MLTIDPSFPCISGDTHLAGRGVVLVPSLFCPPGYPLCWAPEPGTAPVLHYPVVPTVAALADLLAPEGATGGPSALAALLGRTRAAVLAAVADGPCTNGELARRAGTSPPSASEHARALRDAGLVHTRRYGRTVLHTATPLGTALLDPHAPWPPAPAGP